MSQKLKYDAGKLRYDLIPYDVLDEIARVYTVGASKYGDNTWQGVAPERYEAALMRHFSAHKQGEVRSEDDDLYHLACVAWNAVALLWFQLKEDSVNKHRKAVNIASIEAQIRQAEDKLLAHQAELRKKAGEKNDHDNDIHVNSLGYGFYYINDVEPQQVSEREDEDTDGRDSESSGDVQGSEVYGSESETGDGESKEHGHDTERY